MAYYIMLDTCNFTYMNQSKASECKMRYKVSLTASTWNRN